MRLGESSTVVVARNQINEFTSLRRRNAQQAWSDVGEISRLEVTEGIELSRAIVRLLAQGINHG